TGRREEHDPLARAVARHAPALLVHPAGMPPAEEHAVREAGLTPVGPEYDEVRVGEAEPAAREAAAAVAHLERAAERGRDRAGPAPDPEHPAVRVRAHLDEPRVAGEAAGSFRGNARAVLELGAPGLAAVLRERRVLHVQQHLVR